MSRFHPARRTRRTKLWRLSVWLGLLVTMGSVAAGGCHPTRPSTSVSTTFSKPIPNPLLESALRSTPGVEGIEAVTPPPRNYLFYGRRQDPDEYRFSSPDLSGAEGRMQQGEDMYRRTHLYIGAMWASPPGPKPTAQQKSRAKAQLENILENVKTAFRNGAK